MKIEQTLKSVNGVGTTEAKRTPPNNTQAGVRQDTPRASADNVQLTSLSAQLQALEKNLGNVSAVDSSRVDEIKKAISEGRFQVNAEAVASSLIKTAKEYLA